MEVDLTRIPTTLDAVHIGLAALAFLLLFMLVLVLSMVVVSLIRRQTAASLREAAQRAEAQAVEPIPAERVKEKKKVAALERPAKPAILKESTPDAALQLLGLLQAEARFIDFIEEDISAYSDAEVGAAARIVHEGCKNVLNEHFKFEPVHPAEENTRVTIPKGFDASQVRLVGNIVGAPPFTGTLVHRGWRVTTVKLPKLSETHDVKILAAAEVEL